MSVLPSPEGLTSHDFPVHWPVLTRWTDNDMFGHLNNAVYYQLFDTTINGWIAAGAPDVDPVAMPELGVVAESGCRFLGELGFPDRLTVGLAVTRLGRSSVTYRLAVFRTPDAEAAEDAPLAALGHWVHVYVDRTTRRPVPIPDGIRALLATAQV
ncbi:acyl-CoA thioesterase [[Mycobacterium] crassicus]|uniref:Thioesterase family protein n=1 Tax=[Mycobacterium] crassicus TaxID=2872309 RepID=A0ABU5XDY7_9MYCO|nr:thioesterase family protein [Mycolicibacter sp. MYC098]MEB3020189.1 thioesterase family protein [Mycolicibacter sp. MYC098]